MKYLRNLGASLRNTCEGAHIDQSLRASASNFTKHETPSRVFPKDPAHLLGTPIIPRNIFQCHPLIIFVLSKYMYFIVILTSVFGLFIFTRFNNSNYMCKYGTYTFLRPMVWWVFLNTSNVSADLIWTGREFQIFGPREVRLFVPNS